jgi:enamine deaminase RidA (YjgF/YER057c/UK114 family)
MAEIEWRLRSLGVTLPDPPQPIGRFRHGRVEGNLLFLSGQGPLLEDGRLAVGKVGRGVTAAAAREHARRTGLVLLAAIRAELGSLDAVKGPVKLLGFVNCTEDFDLHAHVIDGCSELFHEVFGDHGAHARSAIGVSSLPGGITVEIEAIVGLHGDTGPRGDQRLRAPAPRSGRGAS